MYSPFERLPGTVVAILTWIGGVVGPASAANPTALWDRFRQGTLRDVEGIVFAARGVNPTDGHWYANFGYYAHDPDRKAYAEGAKLYRFNLKTRALEALVEDSRGGIRDPQVHYGGRRILFSYRPGGTEHYHLYELDLDGRPAPGGEGSVRSVAGGTLRQITSGSYDDIEPSYLPDGGIVFVSSRCKRWVNCWLTQVAVLHRCEIDGSNLRALSSNNEHDNTPWPLPDGRILYTRWEYVDRSQVHFHHLWAMNPDGTGQSVWFGNLHPGTTMIDAKPIPNSHRIVASFSPGHGQREHDGVVTVVDPKAGPDAADFARSIGKESRFRDPWAFAEDSFMAASRDTIVLIDGRGANEVLVRLPEADRAAKLECHEPRPLAPRPEEVVIQSRAKPEESTGRFLVADVHQGRRMDGVSAGEIRKLLVLETLPMPIHYTGGMEPISYGGTFTLERILGTVPVESDGSAYFEVPAMRSVFFVALDANDMAVKRMQSFTTVQPGEMLSCVGCHEHRAQTPRAEFHPTLAVRKPAAKVEPITDVPEVFDYPRDIQPVLDELCVDCHGPEATPRGGPRAGRLLLTGDRGPMYSHSYYMMTIARLVADGRNQPVSNYQPRALGSSASRLLKLIDGSHYGVRASERQARWLRLWIESGAAYPGTYAALGCGMLGNYAENVQVNLDTDWPTTRAGAEVLQRRCSPCHKEPSRLLPLSLIDERGVSFWQPSMDDPRLLTSRHIVFNLSRPEKSTLLLAPLAKQAGGWGLCRERNAPEDGTQGVLRSVGDRDYAVLLAMIAAGRDYLEKDRRFDMPGFRPRHDWVREMKRYGVLPASLSADQVTNVYEVEQAYWKSLWHVPGPDVASHGILTPSH